MLMSYYEKPSQNWNILFLKHKSLSIDRKLMEGRNRGKWYYLQKQKTKRKTKKKHHGMDCMTMPCPTKRYKQINNVIQAECSRSTPRHAWSKLFFNKPPSSLQARLLQGHGRMGIWSARDDGWIPRRIWGEIRDVARSLFFFFFFLSILRPNEDEERGI